MSDASGGPRLSLSAPGHGAPRRRSGAPAVNLSSGFGLCLCAGHSVIRQITGPTLSSITKGRTKRTVSGRPARSGARRSSGPPMQTAVICHVKGRRLWQSFYTLIPQSQKLLQTQRRLQLLQRLQTHAEARACTLATTTANAKSGSM